MLSPKAQFWSCSMTSCHWLNNILFSFKTKQKLKPFTTVEPHIFSAFSAFLLLCAFSSVVWSNRINAAPLNHPLALFALPPCIKHIGDASDPGLIPGLGRSPGRGNGNPLQHSYLGKPMGRRAAGLQSMGSQRVRCDWACTHWTQTSSGVDNPLISSNRNQSWQNFDTFLKYYFVLKVFPKLTLSP